MSARLLSACVALTMLLLAGGWASTAKPPDLPAIPKDTGIPLALGTPNGVLMLRLGNSSSPSSHLVAQAEASDVCIQDETEEEPPVVEVIEAMPREAEVLEVMPQETEQIEVQPRTT